MSNVDVNFHKVKMLHVSTNTGGGTKWFSVFVEMEDGHINLLYL